MNRDSQLIKDEKDVGKLVKLSCQIIKLRIMQGGADRQAMIRELSSAQALAKQEIREAEQRDGDINQIPWELFPDEDLSRKIYQYEQALCKKGIKEIGEKAFNEFLENVRKEFIF